MYERRAASAGPAAHGNEQRCALISSSTRAAFADPHGEAEFLTIGSQRMGQGQAAADGGHLAVDSRGSAGSPAAPLSKRGCSVPSAGASRALPQRVTIDPVVEEGHCGDRRRCCIGVWTTSTADVDRSTRNSLAGACWPCTNAKRSRRHAGAQAIGGQVDQPCKLGARRLAALEPDQLSISGNSDLCLLLGHRPPARELSIQCCADGRPGQTAAVRPRCSLRPADAIAGECPATASRLTDHRSTQRHPGKPSSPGYARRAVERRPRRAWPALLRITQAPSPDQPGLGRHGSQRLQFRLLPRLEHLIDRGCGLLNRSFSHVQLGPVVPGEQAPREDEFAADPLDVGIVAAVAARRRPASSPSIRCRVRRICASASGLIVRPTISGRCSLRETVELLSLGHDRHVGGLDAAVGEVDAGRCLGGPRHADQHDVGTLRDRRGPGRRRGSWRSRSRRCGRK